MNVRASTLAASWACLPLGMIFLSSVVDRLGRLGPPSHHGMAWGDFARFLPLVARMNWLLPSSMISSVGWKETSLEGGLGDETGARPNDVEPWAVAGALMRTHQALVGYVRTSVLVGRQGPRLAADARAQARRAFARLERGMRDCATKLSG